MSRQRAPWLHLMAMLVAASWWADSAIACPLTVTAGDDVINCNSGAAGNLVDTQGNNSLIFSSGNGSVVGVSYGAGNDLIEMNTPAAVIGAGGVSMGDGANIFRLFQGQVQAAILQGAGDDIVQISGGQAISINQSAGKDSFQISGGTIRSLAQGTGIDQFVMSSGTITDYFEDGDLALMTGGRIGRVDMKLDDNTFDMRGGTIVGNLVTGFGNDTILVSGTSFIGGNISVSGGTDSITLTGGTVNGQILASAGNDTLTWSGGGKVNSFILMGANNDTALLQNLTEANVAPTPVLDGGDGVDTLTFDNTRVSTPARYSNWETVNLDNNSQMTLGGTFTLGGSDTGTGTLNNNGTSTLLVGTGIISAFDPAQSATLNNRGLIDMTTGSSIATDTLTVNGNYNGNAGVLALQTVLGDDNSQTDKLIVSRGTIGGTTTLQITNLGGSGAATAVDGIRVVDAQNGATSASGAFSLGNAVAAGPYSYFLYRGGVSAGTQDSWFLRSQAPVINPPEPEGPVTPLPEPVPGGPELPKPTIRPVLFIRPEVSLAATLYPAAQQVVRQAMGTFHERVGEQDRQREPGAFSSGWTRVYGGGSRQRYAGGLSNTLDSSISGYQVGTTVFSRTTGAGDTQNLGLFAGQNRLRGDVKGLINGLPDRKAGDTTLRGASLGLTGTHIWKNGAYTDVVVMHTRLSGHNESDRGIKMKTKGHDLALSVEVGTPFELTPAWNIEPQVQMIWNRTRFDSQKDPFSSVSYDSDDQLTLRVGVRASGHYVVRNLPVTPYVRANVWHTPQGKSTVTFNDVDFDTEQKSTTLDLSLGAGAALAPDIVLYGEVSHSQNLDSLELSGTRGTLGLRMAF